MSDSDLKPVTEEKKPITPLRCLTGSSISGLLAIAAYKLMMAIAQTYATKPINFSNPIAVNIASAVRTLIVGVTALAASILAMVTLGLCALAIKLIFQQKTA
jgi:hypothetical protein